MLLVEAIPQVLFGMLLGNRECKIFSSSVGSFLDGRMQTYFSGSGHSFWQTALIELVGNYGTSCGKLFYHLLESLRWGFSCVEACEDQ